MSRGVRISGLLSIAKRKPILALRLLLLAARLRRMEQDRREQVAEPLTAEERVEYVESEMMRLGMGRPTGDGSRTAS